MKLYIPNAWALLTIVALAEAQSCKRLTDTSNVFTTSVAQLTQTPIETFTTSTSEIRKSIDTQYPWLSTCLASVDVNAIVTSLTLNNDVTQCTTDLNNMPQIEIPDWSADSTVQKALLDQVCPFYKDKAVPCINKVLVKVLVDAMNGGGKCCDSMKAEILKDFGSDLAVMVDTLTKRLGNVLCATRQVNGKTQACAAALIKTMSPIDRPMEQMLQIPTAEACKAMSGEKYLTTTGSTDQFPWKTAGVEPLGICYEPFSALMQTIGAYPIISTLKWVDGSTTAMMSDFFAPGKCVKGQVMIEYLTSIVEANAASIDATYGKMSNMTAKDGSDLSDGLAMTLRFQGDHWPSMCFHVANGQTCNYGTTTLSTPYTIVTTTDANTKTSEASTIMMIMSMSTLVALVSAFWM